MKPIDSALNNALKNLGETLEKRREKVAVQLPVCGEDKRGTPNSFLRSSLFAAIQSKDRYFTKKEVLYAQKGITVEYTGERLNQEDLTLWETLVHLAKESPLGDECFFTAHSILKAMKLNTGGDEHKRLDEGITRLIACAVKVRMEGKGFTGSLVENSREREGNNKHYYLRLSRELIRLYGDTEYTAIDWGQRLELRRKPLALFLHGYYSSHREPFPIKLETLYQLAGSQNGERKGFKRRVKAALEALVAIGFLESYQIKGDLVSVKRNNKAALPE